MHGTKKVSGARDYLQYMSLLCYVMSILSLPPSPSLSLSLPPDPPSLSLLSLSLPQILKMLDSMGLSQYQEVFSSQQINGDLLLECDDKMLE